MVAIQTPLQTTIVHDASAFGHEHADRLSQWVTAGANNARKVVLDLSQAAEASTSAFARLVLLRRSLLKNGRDLKLINLHSQARQVYELNRLMTILPCA